MLRSLLHKLNYFMGKPRQRHRKITLERLEDRIVLDAAIAAAIDDQDQLSSHNTDVAMEAGAKTVEQSAQAQNAPTQAANLATDACTDPLSQIYSQDLSQILVTNAQDALQVVSGTDSTGGAHCAVHVLVVSSAVQSADQLLQAAGDGVLTVLYNAKTDSPDDILSKIDTTLAGKKADAIAFATHETGAGQFYLTGDYTVNSSSLLGSAELQDFWKGVGSLVNDSGRIDLLACGLVSSEAGNLLLSQLETLTGKNFAASDDPTGNIQSGGDWVLESDGVDVAGAYFAKDGLAQFTGVMDAETKVIASDGASGDKFGWSVSIDGNYAFVGASSDDITGVTDAGSVYIYKLGTDGTWIQTAHLVAPDGANNYDSFGDSVSISGNYAIVGSSGDDIGANQGQGSAYIYVLSGGTWNYQTKLTAPDGAALDTFGYSVSIDGDHAIVGAYYDTVGSGFYHQGSAYIYDLSGGIWNYQTKLTAPDAANYDSFGWSVSINGNYAIVGAYADTVGANADQGSTYIYEFSGGTWNYKTKLTAIDGAASDIFGLSVSINGNYAIVGACGDDEGSNTNQGSAYIYELSGGTWNYLTKLISPDAATNDQFGVSVSINGNYAVVGVDDTVGSNDGQGSAYLYEFSGETWNYRKILTASDGAAFDGLGWQVSISGDYAIAGALNDDVGANTDQGSAYIFALNQNPANNAPTALTLSADTVEENQSSGIPVGSFTTTDPDSGETFTYSLVSGSGSTDNGSFTIEGNTLKTNSSFDYENKNAYSIRIRTTDHGGLYYDQQFSINVGDVNEAPIALTLSNNSVSEHVVGAVVGTVSVVEDPDMSNHVTYILSTGGDNDSFTIDPTTGVLSTKMALDYNIRSSYNITAHVEDPSQPGQVGPDQHIDQAFTINVNDVNTSRMQMLDDINPGSIGSDITRIISVGGVAYYVADDGIHGHELWKSDGTDAGTAILKDINPNGNGLVDGFNELYNLNGTLYFVADDGTHGRELWKSDGTEAGTVMVKDINGSGSSLDNYLVDFCGVNGIVYFVANDGTHGSELWKSDGTATGTVMVKDIRVGSYGSFNGDMDGPSLTNVNGTLYFSAYDGTNGQELWKSNGTTSGTVMVKNIVTNAGSSYPQDLRNVNGELYFVANDDIHGFELWKSDGTATGTVMVKDINPGTQWWDSSVNLLEEVNGTLFFTATDGVHGAELWKTDGTMAGTVMVKDVTPGSSSSYVSSFSVLNGTLYFQEHDGVHGTQLWKSNGTSAGTVMVKEIDPSPNSNQWGLTNVNGNLYFAANDNELWKSDGTTDGTVMVKDVVTGSSAGYFGRFSDINGMVCFTINDGIHGPELWKSDGTALGTLMVKDINQLPASGSPVNFIATDNTLYFWADDGFWGSELRKINANSDSTVLVKDIATGSHSSKSVYSSQSSCELNGELYFSAYSLGYGGELWKTNGSESGTMMVKDIYTGYMWSDPDHLTRFGNTVYFLANDGVHGPELWKTDGTASGTMMVKDVNPNNSAFYMGGFADTSAEICVAGNILYFVADDGQHGYELWKSDGTAAGTVLVKDINPNSSDRKIYSLTDVNGVLYFMSDDGLHGSELWKSDGTASGTVMVKDINPSGDSLIFDYSELLNLNGVLYCTADDGVHGRELWKSDGSAAGTVMVSDINPGDKTGSWPSQLTNVNGALYFEASDGTHGSELWKSDGSVAGTVMVSDIYAGVRSGLTDSSEFCNVNGTLFLVANDGVHGDELYKSDGTSEGTFINDIFPGSSASSPTDLTALDGKLYFSADDGVHGREIWVYDNTNQTPTSLTLSNNSVNENLASGTTVGTFATTDPDSGDTFTYSLVTGFGSTDNGSFTIEGNTLKTNACFDHETKDSYAIRIRTTDGAGASHEQEFAINVVDVNDSPSVVNDAAVVNQGSTVTIAALENDSDADGDSLTMNSYDIHATKGLVTFNEGIFTYNPNSQFNYLAVGETATDTFEYTVSDGHGGLSTGTVTVTMSGVNDPPTAVADTTQTNENSSIIISAVSNDTDVDTSDILTVSSVNTTGTKGLVKLENGILTYDPNGQFESLAAGQTSTDKFSYTVSDGHGGTSTAVVNVSITGVNDEPAATNLEQPAITYKEGAVPFALPQKIVVADADTNEQITATLTLSDTTVGSLTALSKNGETYNSTTGVWTVTNSVSKVNLALAGMKFKPLMDNDRNAFINVNIQDGLENDTDPRTGTIVLNVTPVNDRPTVTNFIQTAKYTEDISNVANGGYEGTVVGWTNIVVKDPDTGEILDVSLVLANKSLGYLTADSGKGEIYNASTGIWNIHGNVESVNQALASARFIANSNNDIDTWITVAIQDSTGLKTSAGKITMDVTPVNDQTTATNLTQTIEYIEVDSELKGFPQKIVVTDVDPNEVITAKLTLSNKAVGSLTYDSKLGSSYNPGLGVWMVTGNVAKVNAALEGVQFRPSDGNELDATIAVDIRDGLENGKIPVTGSIKIDVTPVNQQTNVENLTQKNVAYNEGASFVGLSKIVVTDGDIKEQITAMLTLSDTTVGSLTATTKNGETYDSTTGVWSITNSVAKVNLALAGMKFKPQLNNDQNAFINVNIQDGLENDTDPKTGTIILNVTPVNDAPTATNLIQTVKYTEEISNVPNGALEGTVVGWTNIVVKDPDTNEILDVNLALANKSLGYLTADSGKGEIYNASTGIWNIHGNVESVNQALASAKFIANPNNDLDTWITVAIQDSARLKTSAGKITLDVTPVNDQAEATNVTQTIKYIRGETIVDIPEKIFVTDVDPNEVITAKLTVSNKNAGSLTSNTKLGSSYNVATGIWTVTGTVGKVNAALEAVQFKPSTGNDLDATISVDIRDGLENKTNAVTGKITLDVTHLPVANAFSEGGNEDTTIKIDGWSMSDEDTGDTLSSVTITSGPAHGTLYLRDAAILAGQVIDVSDLGYVTFVPDAGWNGTTTFGYKATDSQGGTSSDSTNVALNVSAVNDIPTTLALSVSGHQDSTIAVNGWHINDAEDGDNVAPVSITVMSLPEHGVLKVNGSTATLNQIITSADFDHVTFQPDSNWLGTTTFTYKATDSQGGVSSNTATGTLVVAPVNAPPDVPVDRINDGNLLDGYWDIASTENGIVQWYRYDKTTNQGQWWWNNGASQFRYHNETGQWDKFDSQTGLWETLGIITEFNTEAVSGQCLYDGQWHDLGNGWSFGYIASNGIAEWKDGSDLRFKYDYSAGQWSDYSKGVWITLGDGSQTSSFIGDGTYHQVNAKWLYMYDETDSGNWERLGHSAPTFKYDYGTGQWFDWSTNSLQWLQTTTTGKYSSFIGDGNLWYVGNESPFIQVKYDDSAWGGSLIYTNPSSIYDTPFLRYDFATGKWQHEGTYNNSSWYDLLIPETATIWDGEVVKTTTGHSIYLTYMSGITAEPPAGQFAMWWDYWNYDAHLFGAYYEYGTGKSWAWNNTDQQWQLLGSGAPPNL